MLESHLRNCSAVMAVMSVMSVMSTYRLSNHVLCMIYSPMMTKARLFACPGLVASEHPRRLRLVNRPHVYAFPTQCFCNSNHQVLTVVLPNAVVTEVEDLVKHFTND